MAKRSRKRVVDERWEAKAVKGKTVKQKFGEERSIQLRPLTERQAEYMRMIEDQDLILCTGLAGTSKSHVATAMACQWYREGLIESIVVSRPAISNSKSLGFYGGNLVEKMTNWLEGVLPVMYQYLGRNVVELAIKRGDIKFVPLEVIKGFSANDCFFIVDEAEDITFEEAKKIVTRQGRNCTMVLSGDVSQSELKERSGLKMRIDMARKYEIDIGIMDFNRVDDIVRSDQCKQWIMAFTMEESK